jgi:hypothetical protein
MKKSFIVRPTGLKGSEKVDRMKDLMGIKPLNEDVKNSVVELTKLGPDGKVYGIVREGHNYFIKVTDKQTNVITEDFNYIGGLMNKTSEVYPSYAKAIKHLNLKFMSLNEAYGKQGNYNVFEDDNLLTEHHPYSASQTLSASKGMGDGAEYIVDKAGVELSYDSKEGKEDSQFGDNLAEKDVMDEFEGVTLSENEMAIEKMLSEADEVQAVKQAADEVADEIKDVLSPDEIEFLKSTYHKRGKEMVANAISSELNESIYENTPVPPSEGEFGMSQDEIKLRQIIDKLIKPGAVTSFFATIPAMMSGHPWLALGLGIASLAGVTLKDYAWWSRKEGHNYKAQDKYGIKEAEGEDKNNPWAICYSSLGIHKKPEKGDANYEKFEACVRDVKKEKGIKEHKFSISKAIDLMEDIVDENDRVTEILNSLTESEKEALLSTLKKKV